MAKKVPPKKRGWVSLTLPRDVIDRVERQAAEEMRNRSQMILVLLVRALAQNEKTA